MKYTEDHGESPNMHHACTACGQSFDVTDEDLAFYDKVSPVFGGKKMQIPAPTLCPACRRQRRLAWRNERTLYQRPCDLCAVSTISVHSPENSYPVYCNTCWRGTSWDPLIHGRTFDPARPFFEQFKELYHAVPQRAMVSEDGLTCENCAYCFDISYSKNCYFVFGTWKTEDSLYTNLAEHSKFCVDSYDTKLGSQWVYECLDSQHLYNCIRIQNSDNCSDCVFGFDLKGCQNCIGCVSLRQKQYCIFNEQFSEAEYKEKALAYRISSYPGLTALKDTFKKFLLQFPVRALNQQNCEECTGDHLFNCKNVLGFIVSNSEHAKWIERSDAPVHCYDIVQSGNSQWSMEQITGDNTYGVHFSMYCNHSKNLLYCSDCLSCEHCLGCISLRNKKYCIFNKQYTKDEYETLAASIISSMQVTEEFGEFFSINTSPFGYNETNAGEFFPLTEADVLGKGWQWRRKQPYTTGKETLLFNELPDDIREVSDDVVKEVLACATCAKNYRIIAQELDFYRRIGIPLPRSCADCRYRSRLQRRNPFSLFQRTCARCHTEISTSYAPENPAIVYCDECYMKEVY